MSSDLLDPLAFAAALAVASGLRFYGVVFFIGVVGATGWVSLPGHLSLLTHPVLIAVSGLLFFLEFFADKIPVVDSVWDAFNTFVRVPGGALLAGLAMADNNAALIAAAGLLGGTLAGGTHVAKAGSRAILNLSPEPVSNWAASFSEDGLSAGVLLLLVTYPMLALCAVVLFALLLVWLLPKVFRSAIGLIRRGLGRVRAL